MPAGKRCQTCEDWGGIPFEHDCPNGEVVRACATCNRCGGEGILSIKLTPSDQGIEWCGCVEDKNHDAE